MQFLVDTTVHTTDFDSPNMGKRNQIMRPLKNILVNDVLNMDLGLVKLSGCPGHPQPGGLYICFSHLLFLGVF